MKRFVAILSLWAIAGASTALLAQTLPSAPFIEPLMLSAKPVPLNANDPAQTSVGRLTYVGGVEISSAHPLFGGVSGMRFTGQGLNMIGVSDEGRWISWTLVEQNGQLTGVEGGFIAAMLDDQGKRLVKSNGDAEAIDIRPAPESIAPAGLDVVLVAFEGETRVLEYIGPFARDAKSAFGALPSQTVSLSALGKVPNNGGPEAFGFVLGRASWLAVSEDGEGPEGSKSAVLNRVDAAGGKRVTQQIAFGVRTSPGYKPTDVVKLNDDTALLLTRYFNPLSGVAAELSLLPLKDVKPGTVVSAQPIARLAPPLSVDNMEAVAVRTDADGSTAIYIMSDNNFSGLQRTLLMKFRLAPRSPTK
jgi:hypothetical protein